MRPRARFALPAAAAVCAMAALPAWAASTGTTASAMKVLSRDTLPSKLLADPVGAPSATAHWHVGVSVAGRDAAGLAALERAQYDKASPLYRHFLTPAEYAAQFGADPDTTAQVRSWLAGKGLHVTYADKAQTYLVAEGTVAQVEKTFRVTLRNYVAGTTQFTANTTAPTVPSAVTAVAGLDTLSTRATTAVTTPAAFPIPSVTTPKDLWSVYEQPSDNTGQGEQIASFGWGDPSGVQSDLRQFESENSLPQMPFTVVQVGDKGTDTSGLEEWDIDSQASSGMAPGAAGLTFYFANSGSVDLLAQSVQTWADDPAGAKQASGSYGLCDALGFLGVFDAHEAALTQAAVEGRSFFASTGDNGSGCSAVVDTNGITIGPIPSQEYPATSPHAVAVGGTVLYTTGSPAQRDQEIAWTHGGGGPSYSFSAPDWQAGQPLAAPGRAVADVSAQSGDLLSGYSIVNAGTDTVGAGTSLSAPLWQGMWARVNAAGPLGADGVADLGFAAPLIYANNTDATKYADSFTDITVGDNGLYPALPGYDYPTGWGVPRVTGLAQDLAGKTTPSGGTTTTGGGTTGGGSTPPPPLPECQPAPQVVDPSGDATQAAVTDTGAAPASRGDLDIVDYGITWDAVAQAMTATLHVSDLSAQPSTGENYRLAFSHDGVDYEIQATRDVSGATTFTWDVPTINASSLGDLTGSFDPASNAITVVLTAAEYAAAQPANAPLADGSSVSSLSALAQQEAGTTQTGGATLTADNAATAQPCQVTFPVPVQTATTCPTKSKGKPSPDCKKH